VQVLYGQLFYTSSVLVGGFWIMVIPLLITAYGLLYAHKLARESRPRFQTLSVAVALLAMLFVGFIYVNNLTLLLTPERWLAKYAAHTGGMTLNMEEPTHGPRYLFFILPAFAVAGLAFMLRGAYLSRWGHAEEGRRARRLGFVWVVVGVVGVSVGAAGLLATFPAHIRDFVLARGAHRAVRGGRGGRCRRPRAGLRGPPGPGAPARLRRDPELRRGARLRRRPARPGARRLPRALLPAA